MDSFPSLKVLSAEKSSVGVNSSRAKMAAYVRATEKVSHASAPGKAETGVSMEVRRAPPSFRAAMGTGARMEESARRCSSIISTLTRAAAWLASPVLTVRPRLCSRSSPEATCTWRPSNEAGSLR